MSRQVLKNGHARRGGLPALCALVVAGACAHAAAGGPANAPTTTYAFKGGNTGAQPTTGLVLAADGYFYGTNASSAPANSEIVFDYWGGVYRVKPDGSGFQMLHTFTGHHDGGVPAASVLVGADGALYGSSSIGEPAFGTANGTLWKLTPGGAFSVLHTFTAADGAYPSVPLLQDKSGTLYGAAAGGGGGGRGVIFSMRPDGSAYTVLHQFSGDSHGGGPIGLAFGKDGALYGATTECDCAVQTYGTAFTMAADGSGFKTLHVFDPSVGEGRNPHSGVVQQGSWFYGTTNGGGKYGDDAGTVYRFDAAGHFNTVASLQMLVDGAYPTSPMLVGANGNLYGTSTAWGPDQETGALYEITTKGVLVGVEPLTDVGLQAQSGLSIGPDGRLYTPLVVGGPWQAGAIVSVSQDFDKVVPPAPVVQFHINAQPPVITLGQTVTLSWSTQDATACKASGAWSGDEPLSGTQDETPAAAGQYAYTLTCSNAGGSTAVTNNLFVNAAR